MLASARRDRRNPRPCGSRRLLSLHSWIAALSLLVALGCAAPATAEVKTIGTTQVGLQPRSTDLYQAGERTDHEGHISGKAVEAQGAYEFANPAGNPVVSSAKAYAIYWDPEDVYHGNWQHLIDEFFANLSTASGGLGDVFAVDTQYTDAEGQHATSRPTFAGSYTDTDPYPALPGCADPAPLKVGAIACLSGEQVEAELERFIADHSLPKGMGVIYYLLTPPGVTDCLAAGVGKYDCSDYAGEPEESNASYEDSFCSYHGAINPGGNPDGGSETVLYAAIPWAAGGLGDYHIEPRSPAYECQDGGWEPKAPGGFTAAETPEPEPLQQEPNQSGSGPDGSYDAGLADLIIGQIATEQQDIVTDPLLNAWQTVVKGGGKGGGQETTDLCRNFFAPALGGVSGAETEEEKLARIQEEKEIEKTLVEGGMSEAEAEAQAKAQAKKKPHHGEEGTEAGELYNEAFGGAHYYLNDAFDLAGVKVAYPGIKCLKGLSLEPSFTAPTNVNAGELVGFDGMESNITLDEGTAYSGGAPVATYPTYEWSFGDGSSVTGYAPGAPSRNSPEVTPCELPWQSPCAASAFHSYTYGGTYEVTLKITDTGGNVASITKPIVVDGPPPPTPPASAPSPGQGSTQQTPGKSSGSKSGKGKKSKTSKAPLPRPVATAMVATTSLTTAIEKGVPVRYSVNQQVAGHFEVMMPTRVAKRLKVKGPAAVDLPKGEAPQTVIAAALLVTTRSAHGALKIKIPSATALRLAHLQHLTITLRLVVRNASRSKPKATLLQTTVKLRR